VNELPIFGFMHVAMINHWREIVEEQILKMKASGLWDRAERIFVGLLGPGCEEFPCDDPRLHLTHFGTGYEAAELPTLSALQQFCRSRDCLVFYVHTKGVFSPADGTRDWRRSMEHFIIMRYEDCIAKLADHDICGINWHSSWCRFFGGNFWWARSDYVRTLPDICSLEPVAGLDLSRRHVCERWIGENPAVRSASLHESRTHHYRDEYPRSRYAHLRELAPARALPTEDPWCGLENRFRDLLEPVAPVRRVAVIAAGSGASISAIAEAAPDAIVIGVSVETNRSTDGLLRLPNTVLLRMPLSDAARAVEGQVDVIEFHEPDGSGEIAGMFRAWEPKVREGGCVLFTDTLSEGESARFFRDLPGRKAELRQGRGIGAWYKGARRRSEE
jgi:hypothetical protein